LSGTCHKEPDEQRVKTVTEAYSKTAFANPLNPDAFPGIRKMEAEVVRMCCNLFNGDPDSSCGTVIFKKKNYIKFTLLKGLGFLDDKWRYRKFDFGLEGLQGVRKKDQGNIQA
jgi:hypothetical protein